MPDFAHGTVRRLNPWRRDTIFDRIFHHADQLAHEVLVGAEGRKVAQQVFPRVRGGVARPPPGDAHKCVYHVFSDRLVIALPEGHRYAAAPLTDLAQLAHENFVLCRRYADPGYRELVEGICREAGFTPRVLQAVEQKQTVLELVAQGLGVSIVQESAAERSTGVRYQAFPRPVSPVATAVVWREDAHTESIAPLVTLAEREAVHFRARRDVAVNDTVLVPT